MPKRVFENLNPEVKPEFGKTFQWAVVDKLAGRRRKAPAKTPIPLQQPVEVAPASADAALWLGHSTALLTLAGRRILTDPVFAHRISGVVPRNIPLLLDPASLPALDLVLISHNHRDHLDKPSVLQVEAQHQPHYVVPLGVDRYLLAWGIPAQRITTLGWWDAAAPLPQEPELEISLVPAQHWSQRTPFDRNTSLWGGFVLQTPRRAVYFAGDSGYFEGFSLIGERFPGLDLALLPIGAYDPEWFMSPQHMNPEEAGRAMLDLGAARMLSIHWGTYKLTDEPLDEPPARLEDWRSAQKIEPERILTLAAGGQVLL